MKIDFEREKRWWNAKADKEENDLGDEAINRALRWREIEKHLAGTETILEVGGGTGVFSIPLAQRGFAVTHLDISSAMLEVAQSKAGGLTNIHFVEGNSTDLSQFDDASFDLVLNMDGAISFCADQAEQAICESCRVTRNKLIVTVFHRAKLVANWVSASVNAQGRFLPLVYEMIEHGDWHQDQFTENSEIAEGCTQGYLGAFHAFLPDELRVILERKGMNVLRIGGLGSLAHLCEKDVLACILKDQVLLDEFVDICERFDADLLPQGSGVFQRSGLIAVAETCRASR